MPTRSAIGQAGDMTTSNNQRPGTRVLLLAGAVIVIAIILAAIFSNGRVQSFDPGTPEAVAQAYVQAIFDNDSFAAYALLAPELQDECDRHDLIPPWAIGASHARFRAVRIDGDRAVIDVELRDIDVSVSPFGIDDHRDTKSNELELEHRQSDWLITYAAWPIYGCPGR